MKISVIGAGGWGTALAMQAARNHEVLLWAYSDKELEPIRKNRENTDYLPGVKIPETIGLTSSPEVAADAEILLFVAPSKYFRSVVKNFTPYVSKKQILVSATKGFEFPSEKRMSMILKEEIPGNSSIVVISGPSHAEEVSRGVPTTIVAASKNDRAGRIVQEAFSNDTFRLYRHSDVLGVEVAAAAKNVIAIASGMLRGLGLGDNTQAALITRGLAEIKRLGKKLGAREETFAGLAGVGDLIVTCMSRHSRNGRVGEMLAAGKSIEEIEGSMKMVAEGVETVRSLVKFETEYKIDMPISHFVYDVIYNKVSPEKGLRALMQRPLKHEFI